MMPAAEVLALLFQAADLYAKMRDLAAQNGVTDAQLAEADARFQRYYPDPLAGEKPMDPTAHRFATRQDAQDAMTATGLDYLIVRYDDGSFGLWPKGVGPVPGVIVEP